GEDDARTAPAAHHTHEAHDDERAVEDTGASRCGTAEQPRAEERDDRDDERLQLVDALEEAGDPAALHQDVVHAAAPQEQGPHAAGHASDDAGSAPGGQDAAHPVGAADELADHDQRQT